MINVRVQDFVEWRALARQLILLQIPPEGVAWQDARTHQVSLFNQADTLPELPEQMDVFTVPRTFIQFSEKIACHRDPKKWALLYQALWRITRGEPHLLQLATDPLVHQLRLMYKSVGRDVHKMKAFVRFKEYTEAEEKRYIAWYEPDHLIVPLAAYFFQKRFAVMHWAIFTPDAAVCWDREKLIFSSSGEININELDDTAESLWQTYYRAIFNPARIKLKAMRREMPVRFWQHLPETKIMQEMLQEAPSRVTKMLNSQQIQKK